MGAKTSIEWTRGANGSAGASWTPIRARNKVTGKVGWFCTHVTEGCSNCYAESMNKRLGTGLPFKPGHLKDVELFLDEDMLTAPLRWKRGRSVFVCSMTDLFADFVPDAWIDQVFAVMALTPQHTFQVLTKRSKRMRQYLSDGDLNDRLSVALGNMLDGDWIWNEGKPWRRKIERLISAFLGDDGDDGEGFPDDPMPLRNVWLGVSAEDQARADERIPDLLATPASVKFVSAEPLIGPLDIGWALPGWAEHPTDGPEAVQDLSRTPYVLELVIVGGESGPAARPMQITWARSILEQCRAAGVSCFVKQLGADPVWDDGAFLNLRDRKGGDPSEWPDDLRVRELPWAAKVGGVMAA